VLAQDADGNFSWFFRVHRLIISAAQLQARIYTV
jgi:hypothetical protein